MAGQISTERLAWIRSRADEARSVMVPLNTWGIEACADRLELLAEVERQRTEIAALCTSFDTLSQQYHEARTRWQAKMDQLSSKVTALCEIAQAVAEAAVGDEYSGGSWLMFAGYDAETVRVKARALLAAEG